MIDDITQSCDRLDPHEPHSWSRSISPARSFSRWCPGVNKPPEPEIRKCASPEAHHAHLWSMAAIDGDTYSCPGNVVSTWQPTDIEIGALKYDQGKIFIYNEGGGNGVTPSHELTVEQLTKEIERYANENVIGSGVQLTFSEMVSRLETVASNMLKNEVKLINPRMVNGTLVADGLRLLQFVERVNITFSINKGGETE